MRILVVLAVIAVAAQAPAPAARPVLEGLDPVLLIEGQETPGKPEFAVKQGRFLYHFAAADTRDRFQKDPGRFGIQLAGACARMGPPVGGSPDAYHVYKGRIYIFGSQDCYKAFVKAPAEYLASEQPAPVWNPTSAEKARGKATLEKLLAALAGPAKKPSLQGWVETRVQNNGRETRTVLAAKHPDYFRTETFVNKFSFGSLLTPALALSISGDQGRPLANEFAAAIREQAGRQLLQILSASNPEVFLNSRGRLQIRSAQQISVLTVDETGRLRSLGWRGRGPDGTFGEIELAYSDFRDAGGLKLPFMVEGSFNGKVDASLSWSTTSWEIDPSGLDSRFTPPAKIREN